MVRITFNFCWAPLVALDQKADCISAKRHRCRVILRLAQRQAIGLLHVRDNIFLRSEAAPGESGKRQRRRHQFHEIAPVYRVVPFGRRLAGKFPLEKCQKFRIARELLESPPILLAVLGLKLGAHRAQGQWTGALVQIRRLLCVELCGGFGNSWHDGGLIFFVVMHTNFQR